MKTGRTNGKTIVKEKDVKNTIITNPETVAAIEEGRKLLGKTKGYTDFEDFWKAVMDE